MEIDFIQLLYSQIIDSSIHCVIFKIYLYRIRYSSNYMFWPGIWNLRTLHFNNPSVYHYNLHDKQGSLITGYPWQVK